MDDQAILAHINELVEEEHALERGKAGVGLSDDEHTRLQKVEVALDQCWDLLRQRRARRAAGLPVEEASPRAPGTVEHYQQ
jgi:hypothetical protein